MSFSEWFTQVALDGILGAVLGGVLGGVFAWWLLRLTLRHERESEAQLELRTAVGALRGLASRGAHDFTLFGVHGAPEGFTDRIWDVAMQAQEVRALASAWAPALERDLEAFADHFPGNRTAEPEGFEALADWLAVLVVRLLAWSRDPDGYESGPPADWEKLFQAHGHDVEEAGRSE